MSRRSWSVTAVDKVAAIINLATELLAIAGRLLGGSATEEDHRRVDEILPAKSKSAQAAEDIERGQP